MSQRNDYDGGDHFYYGTGNNDDGSGHHHHYRDRGNVDHIIRHDHDVLSCHDYHDEPCRIDHDFPTFNIFFGSRIG
jgi:hypothetical protein